MFKGDAKRFREGKEVESTALSNRVVRDLEKFVEQQNKIDKIVRALFSPKTKLNAVRSKKAEET